MINRILKRAFKSVGYTIEKSEKVFTMDGALSRCVKRGLRVGTVIDVGASDGRWTRDCMSHLPESQYLMVEAQSPHKPALDQLCREKTNASYVLAAAGSKEGNIYFDNSALFGGLASEAPVAGGIEVPVVTIDEEIRRRKLKGPYLVKLDTHGFEVPILEGAVETLKLASLVIIETYNYKLTNTSLRYFEMCEYMKQRGFLSIEMVDFVLRGKDLSFWQMDTFFIPAKSDEFSSQSFD